MNKNQILVSRMRAVTAALDRISDIIRPDLVFPVSIHLPDKRTQFWGIVENRAPTIFKFFGWRVYRVETMFFSYRLICINGRFLTDPACTEFTYRILDFRTDRPDIRKLLDEVGQLHTLQ